MCYVTNKKEIDVCVSCASPKNPDEQKSSSTSLSNGDNKFSFGTKPTEKFSFGILPASKPSESSSFSFGMPKETTTEQKSDGFKFKFGSTDSAPVSSSTAATTFSFGSAATAAPSLFNFGSGPPVTTSSQIKDSKFTFSPVVSQSSASADSSALFTPIASQSGATKSLFAFGNTTPTSGPLFKVNESDLGTESIKGDALNTSVSRFSFGSSKPQENASIFGSAKSDATPVFSFGKADESLSNFGSDKTPSSSIFGTPDSYKSESTNTSGGCSG